MSLSFLTDGNVSDYNTSETLEAMAFVIANSSGVNASDVELVVEQVDETLSDDLIEGNLTLTATLSDMNSTELMLSLADAFNVSAEQLDVSLSAGSVQLAFTIRLPNCSEPLNAEYETLCEDFGGADEEVYDDADSRFDPAALEAAVDSISTSELSGRLGVPVTQRSAPRRRVFRRVERSVRVRVRIKNLGNSTDAVTTASALNGAAEEDGSASSGASIFASSSALQRAMANQGVNMKIRGQPARPAVFEVNSASGQRSQISTRFLSKKIRLPVVLRPAATAVMPMAPAGRSFILVQSPWPRFHSNRPANALQAEVIRARSSDGGKWQSVAPLDCSASGCANDAWLLWKLTRCNSWRTCTVNVPKKSWLRFVIKEERYKRHLP